MLLGCLANSVGKKKIKKINYVLKLKKEIFKIFLKNIVKILYG